MPTWAVEGGSGGGGQSVGMLLHVLLAPLVLAGAARARLAFVSTLTSDSFTLAARVLGEWRSAVGAARTPWAGFLVSCCTSWFALTG